MHPRQVYRIVLRKTKEMDRAIMSILPGKVDSSGTAKYVKLDAKDCIAIADWLVRASQEMDSDS